jgi:hypothetical protein
MLGAVLARALCEQTIRKLRRLGILGAALGAVLAIHVELPLSISIATSEAQAVMGALDRGVEKALARSEREALQAPHSPGNRANSGDRPEPGPRRPRTGA